jgi:hypothetical protein
MAKSNFSGIKALDCNERKITISQWTDKSKTDAQISGRPAREVGQKTKIQ